jgi:hypothetical protein
MNSNDFPVYTFAVIDKNSNSNDSTDKESNVNLRKV